MDEDHAQKHNRRKADPLLTFFSSHLTYLNLLTFTYFRDFGIIKVTITITHVNIISNTACSITGFRL